MITTYTVPDSPADPEAAALELSCGSPRRPTVSSDGPVRSASVHATAWTTK